MAKRTSADQWSVGLCGCGDCGICMKSWIVPGVVLAQARSDFDGSDYCLNFCCGRAPAIRYLVRKGYQIEGSNLGDFCLPMWCPCCVVNQIAQEVEKRGRIQIGPTKALTPSESEWSQGLCSCCKHPLFFFYSLLCPPWHSFHGSCPVSSIYVDFEDKEPSWLFVCCFFTTPMIRDLIRREYGIHGDCYGDMLTSLFCSPCSAVQMYEEVQRRGPIKRELNFTAPNPQTM